MNAGAKGNVTGGSAVDVEALGFFPAARIDRLFDHLVGGCKHRGRLG
jgi:hypothetical protein